MYSNRLRGSQVWESTISSLASPSYLNLRGESNSRRSFLLNSDALSKESTLESHDLVVPIPTASSDASSHPGSSQPHLYLILLTPANLDFAQHATTHARLIRFAHLTGCVLSAIVFLLNPPHGIVGTPDPTATATTSSILALSSLQVVLLADSAISALPVLLLHEPTGLAALVQQHVAALSAARRPMSCSASGTRVGRPADALEATRNSITRLLPHCTAGSSGAMSEHAALVLSGAFGGLSELAEDCWQGGVRVKDVLEGEATEEEVNGVVEFWRDEYVVE